MSKIIVLQGVPASGKSTWARSYALEHPEFVIVNRDSIRSARGKYWIPEQEDYISDIEEFEIRSAISHELNVLIDSTNLNPKTITKWELLAKELKCQLSFKMFEISYEDAVARDKARGKAGGIEVGEKTIRTFFTKYFPDKCSWLTDTRVIKQAESGKPYAVICDLDGTVALRNGRDPYDDTKVDEDTFDPRMRTLLSQFVLRNIPIIFVSGRMGSEICRSKTFKWLEEEFHISKDTWTLLMRAPKDYRPDEIVKQEIYQNQIAPKYNVLAVFDDRDKVVNMWRSLGLLCCQVYYGNF